MLLVFTTREFMINKMNYEGFPLFINEQTGGIHEPAFYFLVYHLIHRGRCSSKNSWDTFGRDLFDYLSFVEAQGREWDDICDDSFSGNTLVSAYRDWSISICGLKPSTVNRRLRFIISFYSHALKLRWITDVPFSIEDVRVTQPKGFLAHIDASGGMRKSTDVMLSQPRTKIKVLSREQIKELLRATKNPVHRLIWRLMLSTGLRREEAATFPLPCITNPRNIKELKSMKRVTLNPAEMKIKGGVERDIDIPLGLFEDLYQYTLHERHQLTQIHGEDESVLFLTSQGRPFAQAGKGLGKIMSDLKLDFKPHPHILRHTFATHTLYTMRELKSKTDPLLYVKNRLGHSSIATTEKYLHFLDEFEDDLMNDYQAMIDTDIELAV